MLLHTLCMGAFDVQVKITARWNKAEPATGPKNTGHWLWHKMADRELCSAAQQAHSHWPLMCGPHCHPAQHLDPPDIRRTVTPVRAQPTTQQRAQSTTQLSLAGCLSLHLLQAPPLPQSGRTRAAPSAESAPHTPRCCCLAAPCRMRWCTAACRRPAAWRRGSL